MDWTPWTAEVVSVIVLLLSACLWFSLIKYQTSRCTAGDLIRQNNSIDLKIEVGQLLCDQSISFPLPPPFVLVFSLSLLVLPSPADGIQGHTSVFLESDQIPGGPGSQSSSETKTEGGGGGEEGGRRASVTSVESETSICSMGQLGNTIANSEWEERRETEKPLRPVSFIHLSPVDAFRFMRFHSSFHMSVHAYCMCVCVYVCVCVFQFPVAGGAPRGWITLCTALMCWLPFQQWLCLTFSTPPTGSPLT